MDRDIVEIIEKFVGHLKGKFDLKQVIAYGEAVIAPIKMVDSIDVAIIVNCLKADYVQDKLELMKIASSVDHRIDIELIDKNSEDPIEFVDELLIRGHLIYPSKKPSN